MDALTFRVDDLSGAETGALIARHLDGMRASSPPKACTRWISTVYVVRK
jgi:hypothetical protein